MAESICGVQANDVSFLQAPFLAAAKLKNITACREPAPSDFNNIPPVFAPEGIEDAQKFVGDTYPAQCKAVNKSLVDSFFGIYDVDCKG